MRISARPRALPLRPLMQHQANCIEWVRKNRIEHPGLFLEMRCGKTLTAIRLATQEWDVRGPCLIAAPITVLEAWEKELALEGESFRVLHGRSFDQRIELAKWAFYRGGRRWLLGNYDCLRNTPGLAKLRWDIVAGDESTLLKSPDSKISKLFSSGFRDVRHRMILSGLPSPEGEADLFQQFKFLNGSFMGYENYYRWRSNYFEPSGMWGRTWELMPGAKNWIKAELYKRAYVLRRQDAGLHGVKVREKRRVPLAKEQRKEYRTVEREFAASLEGGERTETQYVIVQHTWLARIAGGTGVEGNWRWDSKLKELCHLIGGELNDQPIIVWFRFNSEIRAAEASLQKMGVPVRTLMGDSERDLRKETLEWFRSSEQRSRVLLCQIKLAKYGVDASAADTAIYYSMTYSCEEIAQSEDRIFHPMKKSPLLYVYLVAENTIDEDILEAVENKVTSAKMMMSNLNAATLRRALS